MLWPISGLKRLLEGRKFKIEYKEGESISSVPGLKGSRHVAEVFVKVLFRLLEFMMLDVAAGHTVYFDKKVKSRFFVVMAPVGEDFIKGKGLTKGSIKIDLKATKYKQPRFAFDPGYEKSTPAFVYAPEYIYAALVEEANAGMRYTRPTGKKFYFELTPEEREIRSEAWMAQRNYIDD